LTPFYGFVAPPSGGEQCLVTFERGNNNVPVAAGMAYWDGYRAPGISSPGDTQAGEILLKHSSGSYLKLTSDGKVLINGDTEIDITTPTLNITTTQNITINAGGNVGITATGNVNVESTGNVVIDGANVTVTGENVTVTGDSVSLGNGGAGDSLTLFNELKAYIDTHIHSDPQGGETGAPTTPLPSSASTQTVTAN
jgi:uncharacterized protein involved in type VI secretion and phage assembly